MIDEIKGASGDIYLGATIINYFCGIVLFYACTCFLLRNEQVYNVRVILVVQFAIGKIVKAVQQKSKTYSLKFVYLLIIVVGKLLCKRDLICINF